MRELRDIIQQAFDFQHAGNPAAAVEIFEKLLGDGHNDPNIFLGYGVILSRDGYHGLASHMFRQSIEKGHAGYVGAWGNLGECYFRLGRDEAARQAYEKALECAPNDADVLARMSGWHLNRDRAKEAEHWGRKAVKADPNLPQAHSHLALALMEQGKFSEAWPHSKWRWEVPEMVKTKRPYKAPHWNGKHVKTLAVHGEQGVGDEILYASRLNALQGRADRIVVECMERLIPLFRRTWPEIRFYKDHATLIDAEGEPDAYCALGDLFQFCGLPDGKPYLVRPPRDDVFLDRGILRVGLAWRGGTKRTNERERKSALKDWQPILDVPGLEFVSVQYEVGNSIKEAEEAGLKQEVTSRDVEEAAKAIAGCDLVITVCQTAVHLAGAMGVPCWVLTPKRCAWRYSGTDEKSRFYESVKLYRQGPDETWAPVIQRIADDLRNFK